MEITVKVRFSSSRQRIESYGSGKYIVYLIMKEGEGDAFSLLRTIISKYLGVPPSRISYLGKNYQGDMVFGVN